jgi:hypothetical protein
MLEEGEVLIILVQQVVVALTVTDLLIHPGLVPFQ